MALTGRFDFRKSPMGKIVLRVEEQVPAFWSRGSERRMKKRWRDAAFMDLTTTELRSLMDLRFRSRLMTHHAEVHRATPAPRVDIVPILSPEPVQGTLASVAQPYNRS
jgi:hypothetical protein